VSADERRGAPGGLFLLDRSRPVEESHQPKLDNYCSRRASLDRHCSPVQFGVFISIDAKRVLAFRRGVHADTDKGNPNVSVEMHLAYKRVYPDCRAHLLLFQPADKKDKFPKYQNYRFSVVPMTDWSESSIFQSGRRRRAHDVCTGRSRKIH